MSSLAGIRLGVLLALGAFGCSGGGKDGGRHDPPGAVVTSDVHNFLAALDTWAPADTACLAFDAYLRAGSLGLKAYSDKMGMGRKELCSAIRHDPTRYSALRSKIAGIDSAQRDIRAAFVKFAALSPGAKLPAVYFVVGDEMSGGTTTGGSNPIVLVGAELLGSLNGLPVLTVHEFVHTQQHYPLLKIFGAGPTFLHGTLLAQTIKEGSADFLAELATGQVAAVSRDAYGDAHEQQIWHDFERDMHGKDYSQWIYNGWNKKALGDRPTDLAYYVGYRITKAYYDGAADKKAAVREILSIHDFDEFLRESGYDGSRPSAG